MTLLLIALGFVVGWVLVSLLGALVIVWMGRDVR